MHPRASRLVLLASLVLLPACGRVATEDVAPPAEAGAPFDASPAQAADGAPTGVTQLSDDAAPPSYDAGSCNPVDAASLVGRVPVSHRPAGATCPARAPGYGPSNCAFDAGAVACQGDGDCSAGKNGRCLSTLIPPPPICTQPFCSYDQCESDTDCGGTVPCDCRASANDNAPNVCATGSNCRTDSDCGQGGYCSPGGFLDAFCSEPVFFCHGPADECIDDGDCCSVATACVYDAKLEHFACGHGCVPPP